jgi:hypothetical protein
MRVLDVVVLGVVAQLLRYLVVCGPLSTFNLVANLFLLHQVAICIAPSLILSCAFYRLTWDPLDKSTWRGL